MPDIISQYYQGIVQQLRSEVDNINNLFHHQGVKGEGNETILRELLTKFIPKRFGVGTGIVIDRHGTQSRQCDIIIYDTLLYPSLLSLTSVHFFPVDIVYATIEVKTTLTHGSVQEALKNISSVKKLDFIRDQFAGSETKNGSFSVNSYTPTSPMGFIFGYNSDTQQFETFKKWFTPANANEETSFASAVGCLDQGLILLSKDNMLLPYPQPGMIVKGWMLPLMNNEDKPIEFVDVRKDYSQGHHTYPVKVFNNKYVVVDQSRILLLFLLLLQDLLSIKKINPNISFLNTYFIDHPIDMHYEI